MNGAEESVFALDVALADQTDERFLERKGSFLFSESDFLVKVLEGVSPDVVASAVADQQQLGCRDAAATFFGQQELRVNGGEGHGQFLADRILALERKRIGNARNGGGDVCSVQGAENEMPGFRRSYRDAHGFRVAHFADDDNVRSLAQGGAKRGGKVGSVGANFNLLDDAAHVLVLVLDGIFDDDNMTSFAAVDGVHQGGEGGGLARTGRTPDENQAARDLRKRFNRRRKVEFAESGNLGRQDADGRGSAALFTMQVDAEAA